MRRKPSLQLGLDAQRPLAEGDPIGRGDKARTPTASLGLRWRGLLLDVLPDDFQRRTAAGSCEIAATPKHVLPIPILNLRELLAKQAAGNALEAVDQFIAYPQRVKFDGNLAYLPKVGWVKAVIHREIVGKIKTVTVSRESTGKYYASILADDGLPEIAPLPHIERITGVDLGLKDALVSSAGYKSGNPKPLRRALSNLKRKQQAMSRKVEAAKVRFEAAQAANDGNAYRLRDFFGANITKDRKRVAVAHERVRNARDDWQHKASRQLADENQAVAAETLNVKGMMKNRRLSRAIADVGWGGLLLKIDYKLKRRGGRLVKIDRWFPSTKTCSECGAIKEGLTLSDRTWLCAACGTLHDRDENAAENIRRQGILKLKAEGLSVSAHGGGVSRVPSAPATADEVGSLRLLA